MEKQKPEKRPFEKRFEEDQNRIETAVKAFDIDNFTATPDDLRSLEVPGVGIIKFKVLSYDEIQEVHKTLKAQGVADPAEQGFYIIAAMMAKVDGKTTAEKLHKIPGNLTNKIVEVLGKASGFL
jgi:hypothetical protein